MNVVNFDLAGALDDCIDYTSANMDNSAKRSVPIFLGPDDRRTSRIEDISPVYCIGKVRSHYTE